MIKVYNSLTRSKEKFVPIKACEVSFYVCGMTVYDLCHLGHARSMICFDVIARYFRYKSYKVNFVRNITDIDDKIINRAGQEEVSVDELTNRFINFMHQDMQALNLIRADIEPRATQAMPQIIKLIKTLLDKGYAYQGDNDVYFDVEKFTNYGKLSNKDLGGLSLGVRVDIAEDKKSPLDFVLWKQAKPNEPFWSSPWGEGRPGWHIECSAMAMQHLGENIDIHGGGLDLQFPHHENEIAQSEAATNSKFANYWLHVGMLKIDNAKMSKSLGNFLTIRDVLKEYHSELVRFFLLSSHYRSPLNYSQDNINNAEAAMLRLYQTLANCPGNKTLVTSWVDKFCEKMDDDFNTPEAFAVLFKLSREINTTHDPSLAYTLKYLGNIVGILEQDPQEYLQAGINDKEINKLITLRNKAKKEQNWQEADLIRENLFAKGVILEDSTTGTTWRYNKNL